MKTIAAVLLFVACAYGQKLDVFTAGIGEKVAAGRMECAKIEAVDPKHLTRFDTYEDFPTFEEIKCHTMCILNKFKVLNDDHTFKLEALKPVLKEEVLEKIVANSDKCIPEDKKLDTCEKSYNLHRCFLKYL